MSSPMTAAEFERRYRTDPDPWRYLDSDYERAKYAATLAACGPGPFEAALELGGSIGVFSALLAPRCTRLQTIDFSPTAVALARNRLRAYGNVDVFLGRIPDALPAGTHDLVVASEVLYYLTASELGRTLDVLRHRLALGGRLVCIHWRPDGPERPLNAADVQHAIATQAWLSHVSSDGTDDYLLDVFERL
ncbi:MAG TPA: SAM-dependent methyltransferase [Solirubrobacteraceae bacterium]|nr:SAM-dependent methyltransferase [Solirubrobacteraceae bacterium]